MVAGVILTRKNNEDENDDDLDSGEVEDDEEESSPFLGLCVVCQAPLEIGDLASSSYHLNFFC